MNATLRLDLEIRDDRVRIDREILLAGRPLILHSVDDAALIAELERALETLVHRWACPPPPRP